jgi:isoprenylcysteine carboxyl methyltransferase (ICMT) family protein YpbQ
MWGVLLFLVAALVALLVVYYYARNVKRDLDEEGPSVFGQRASIEVTDEHAAQLLALTSEPILLKQSEEGVRVQIDDRPMIPLAAFMGQDVSAALREAAMRVSQAFGSNWTALVTVAEDGSGKVERLS